MFSSTGTICGTPSTTVTGTLTTVVFSTPSTVYLTLTFTSVSSDKSGLSTFSSILTFVTFSGSFPLNVPSAIASFALARAFSFAFSLSLSFATKIPFGVGFGKTVTLTFTGSVNVSPFWSV